MSNPQHWKPFTAYILRWGDRQRAAGNLPPDIQDDDGYWQERRRNEQMKELKNDKPR
jgi:hypothetical protein